MEVVPMSSTKKTGIMILCLAVLAAFAGTVACQKKSETPAAETPTGVHEFEGTVRAALGRYMYLSTAQGFDIVLPGFDAATLVGKTIKVKGNLLADHPPVFLADSLESGPGQVIYTRSQEFLPEDFFEMKTREAVPALALTGITKPEEWEGKGQVKVYGKLVKGDVNRLVLADAKGKEMARIIVDSFSTYANYYIQKLRLFDEFWFYVNVKDSVDRRDRTRTKEIFHADVVAVGLF
jgi:hypothetical protein